MDSSGEYTESTRDLVEIKFNPTDFKRLKFKFKKADQNWASAAEFMFYKEDKLNEKFFRVCVLTKENINLLLKEIEGFIREY